METRCRIKYIKENMFIIFEEILLRIKFSDFQLLFQIFSIRNFQIVRDFILNNIFIYF